MSGAEEIGRDWAVKADPTVESSMRRAEMPFMVLGWDLFCYHRDRVWESSGECRFDIPDGANERPEKFVTQRNNMRTIAANSPKTAAE